MDVAVVELDGKEYTIVDVINDYTYLVNLDNTNDFLIMRDEGDELVSINTEEEFNEALALYKAKMTGE